MAKKTFKKREKKEGDFGEIFFEWQIPEYTEHKRSKRWYVYMIALAVILIIYSIFTANFLFALIIILAGFIVFLRVYAQPRQLKFQITEDGLVIGNIFYD